MIMLVAMMFNLIALVEVRILIEYAKFEYSGRGHSGDKKKLCAGRIQFNESYSDAVCIWNKVILENWRDSHRISSCYSIKY